MSIKMDQKIHLPDASVNAINSRQNITTNSSFLKPSITPNENFKKILIKAESLSLKKSNILDSQFSIHLFQFSNTTIEH